MKKLISIILCVALFLAPCTMIAEDTSVSDWAEEAVKRANAINWTYFGIDNYAKNITRGEFCHLATSAVKSCGLDALFWAMETPFTDIDEDYAIEYLYCLNVVQGKSETLFCPDDLLTREEAAVICLRIIDALREWEVADIKAYEEEDGLYEDYKDISPWAREAVYDMKSLGIMTGTGKRFEAKKNLTYEEAIVMLVRLYDLRWQSSIVSGGSFADRLNALMPREKNYMFSPLSIKMALGLTANGGDADVEEILIDELMDESSVAYYNLKAEDYIGKYTDGEVLSLDVANSIWVNTDITKSDFTDEFKNAAERFYKAQVGKVNKLNAVRTINSWVKDKTKGKIDAILAEDNNDFSAAIVNAVYFKGEWEKAFDKDRTQIDIFTDGDGNIKTTDFMNQTGKFNYYRDADLQVVELPYKCDGDSDVSMFIILCEDDLKLDEKLRHIENGYMRVESVKLSVPKFEIEYADSLKDDLIELGAGKVFNGGFNNILENEELFVEDIVHKTYIKIDEKETEAAATTAVITKATSARPAEPVVFKADRPFYFVIRDNNMDEALFIGRYAFVE